MERLDNRDMIIAAGEVTKVEFSEAKEKALVEIDNQLTFEFKNKPGNARANNVRKMMLNNGEHVICVGGKSKMSPLFSFGYEIKRAGIVKDDSYAFLLGRIDNITKAGKEAIITFDIGKKIYVETDTETAKPLAPGQNVLFTCYIERKKICHDICNHWGISICEACPRYKTALKYRALYANIIKEEKND